MEHNEELRKEREYTAHVQQLLYAIINQSQGFSELHSESIRALLSDAWEELRLKPTALSPQDLEQLSIEVNRFLARKAFTEDIVARYERMLLTPFFARIDFQEDGESENERIVIGLYSLKDEKGNLVVHDWRAPICSLFYDAAPGHASYTCPSGEIAGTLTLKRQYRMEDGKLTFFVDTDVNIEDEMLLDILSSATSRHMRQIVSTIQREQNAAIRLDKEPVLSVVGGAGSGKTSVAMHRASYLLYHNRNSLDAAHIAVISPSSAFIDYISSVLPDLGEENVGTLTMHASIKEILDLNVEMPMQQNEIALDEANALRRESIAFKGGAQFRDILEAFADRFRNRGPEFETVRLGKNVLALAADMEKMYRIEFRLLNPALRLVRIQTVLESRMGEWERTLYSQYESQFIKMYRGKDLEIATRMAVSQRLHPVRSQIKRMLAVNPLKLYAEALCENEALYQAAKENAEARLVWWEDAPAIAWLMLKLGFATPNNSIRQLIIDEAQDYTDITLSALRLNYPQAQVTILGDPNQRTCPMLPPCDPSGWGACFGKPNAPVQELTRCYRATLPITRLLNAVLPDNARLKPFGREGASPLYAKYEPAMLREKLDAWKAAEMRSVAIITRSQAEAAALKSLVPEAVLLTGEEDMLPQSGAPILASYHLMKGLEFDAVAVVWPEVDLGDEERRRLYAACSRALHDCCLLVGENTMRQLAIIA